MTHDRWNKIKEHLMTPLANGYSLCKGNYPMQIAFWEWQPMNLVVDVTNCMCLLIKT
jgi:hypothetical protein